VNVRHLGVVMNKSKSTINGVFRQMRYERVPLTLDNVQSMRSQLPLLSNDSPELKFWSIRRKRATVPRNPFPNEMGSERRHDSEIDAMDFEPDWFPFPELSSDQWNSVFEGQLSHSESPVCYVRLPCLTSDDPVNWRDGSPLTDLIGTLLIRKLVHAAVDEREPCLGPYLALWE
jgi:hypothetical protein